MKVPCGGDQETITLEFSRYGLLIAGASFIDTEVSDSQYAIPVFKFNTRQRGETMPLKRKKAYKTRNGTTRINANRIYLGTNIPSFFSKA